MAYGRNEGIEVEDIIWGVDPYPTMYDEDSNASLYKMVTEDELHEVLKSFKGDKSSGPDRWTMELFTHFFYPFKRDLQHINSTYIALIPKHCPSSNFADFRPISLCNLIYKVISKTIAGCMQSTLSRYISPEQYGFLQDRQIHDVVAIAQECMHSIHTKTLNAAIMQVDLQKAYDCLD